MSMRYICSTILLFLITMSYCGTSEPNESGVYGSVKSIKKYVAKVHYEDGKEVIGDEILDKKYSYSPDGLLEEEESFNQDGELEMKEVYTYFKNRKLKKTEVISQDQGPGNGEYRFRLASTIWEYKINDKGAYTKATWGGDNVIIRREYNLNDVGDRVVSAVDYWMHNEKKYMKMEFDKNERMINRINYRSDYAGEEKTKIEYASMFRKRVVSKVEEDISGNVERQTEETYDNNGWLEHRVITDAEGGFIEEWEYRYEDIDSHGNWGTEKSFIHARVTDDFKLVILTRREITYY